MNESVFISYANVDRARAEWVAWQLEDAGCATFLAHRDHRLGDGWRRTLDARRRSAHTVVALLTADAPESDWAARAWQAAHRKGSRLLPVRFDRAPLPAELADLQALDLSGAGEAEARQALVAAVRGSAAVRDSAGRTVGRAAGRLRQLGLTGPRLAGNPPRVWNLPTRNPRFTGRAEELGRLRQALIDGGTVVVQAIAGRDGVGKTQLALEYGHRFAGDYELAWWVRGGRPGLVTEQLAALAVRTGAAAAHTPPPEAAAAALGELRTRSRWLVVFDDVDSPEQITPHLPEGAGHVLITTRAKNEHPGRTELVLDALPASQAVEMLRARVASLSEADAEAVVSALDGSPFGLALAAALFSVRELDGRPLDGPGFRRLLDEHSPAVPGEEWPGSYSPALAALIRVSVETLPRAEAELAKELLYAFALLAPAPVPLPALVRAGRAGPWSSLLNRTMGLDHTSLHRALDALVRLALLRMPDGSPSLHPLTQAVLRDQLFPRERHEAARLAEAVLVAGTREAAGDERLAKALLPHLLAVEPADLATPLGREAVLSACARLVEHGEPVAARGRLEQLYQEWSEHFGADHPDTLDAAAALADVLARTGETQGALDLLRVAFDGQGQVRGPTHSRTWATGMRLATLLAEQGRYDEARGLGESLLVIARRTFGEDHPDTLAAASLVASCLADLGDTEGARGLSEEVLVRGRRVLGGDHPTSMAAAAFLASCLADLGDTEGARGLSEEVLVRSRRVLGPSHPGSVVAALHLVGVLQSMRQEDEARDLARETLLRSRPAREDYDARTLDAVHLLELAAAPGGTVPPGGTADPGGTAVAEAADRAGTPERGEARVPRPGHAVGDRLAPPRSGRAPGAAAPRAGLSAGQGRSGRTPPAGPRPGAATDAPSVFVDHAPADAGWARWVRWELGASGHRVDEGGDQAAAGSPFRRADVDIVLALFSPDYLGTHAWAASERSRLSLLDAVEQRRFVPLFVTSVDPARLPSALRQTVTPALDGLDEDAARELLHYVLRRPFAPAVREPVFPGMQPSAGAGVGSVVMRQLINALERSSVVRDRAARQVWTDLLAQESPAVRAVPDSPVFRAWLYALVRACDTAPGGLRALASALETLDPDSSEVREVRRIIERIEHQQAAR